MKATTNYVDLPYEFEQAMIHMPDGSYRLFNMTAWRDYGDGLVQVQSDSVAYLTHWQNVVLISDRSQKPDEENP